MHSRIQPAVSRLTISQPTKLRAAISHTTATSRKLKDFTGCGALLRSGRSNIRAASAGDPSPEPASALGTLDEAPLCSSLRPSVKSHSQNRKLLSESRIGWSPAGQARGHLRYYRWKA
jgi:hypothetical protein